MSMKERKWFFEEATVNGNIELDYLNPNYIEMDLETATTFVIPKVFENRPDLISLRFYGNYHLGWLIAHHNNFLDPIFDFSFGKEIDIPDLDEYFRFYKAYARGA